MKCVADRCASIRVQVERPAQIMKPARRQPPQQLRQKLQKRNLVRSPERAARRRKSKLNRREPRRPPVLAALVVRFPFSTTREPRKSEEQTSELQSLMRTSDAVFCLKQKIMLRDRN